MLPKRVRSRLFIVVLLVLACWAGASGLARAQAGPTELTTSTYRILPDSVLGWASPHGKLDWAMPQASMEVLVSPDRRFVALQIPTDLYGTFFRMGGRAIGARSALFLRSTDPNTRYSLGLGFDRFFDVDWSADSKYLAVCRRTRFFGNVDVYRVGGGPDSSITLDLIFRREASSFPDGTSMGWRFDRWRPERNAAVVTKEEKETIGTKVEIPLLPRPIGKVSLTEEPLADPVPVSTVKSSVKRDEPPALAEVTSATCLVLPEGAQGWVSPLGNLNWRSEDGNLEVWASPNRKFVAIAIGMDFPDTSFKVGNREVDARRGLILRSTDPDSRYSLCFGFYKYFDVEWSPDSKYLAISKGYLTHNGDIDVYRVEDGRGTSVNLSLVFRRDALSLPDGKSWIEWNFKRWDFEKGVVIIEEYNHNHGDPQAYMTSTMEVPLSSKPIGTLSLTDEPARDQPPNLPEGAGN